MTFLKESLIELITQTSTNLPPDVRAAMGVALGRDAGTQASQALGIIATNIDMAQEDRADLPGHRHADVRRPHAGGRESDCNEERDSRSGGRGDAARQAASEFGGFAHRQEQRRQSGRGDAGDPLRAVGARRDRSEADPQGRRLREQEHPVFAALELDHLGRADRNLEGVRKCILHAVWQAQGQGCAPGAVGVCIGSDRAHGYELAKDQFFRTLDDVNPDPELAKLEAEIMEEANRIGVGAMGFGGKVSLIGCKIGAANRSARELLRVGGLRLLGVPAAGRAAGCIERRDHASGCIAIPIAPCERMARGGRIPADRPRSGAHRAALRRTSARACKWATWC